jgi:hypothetical protein
VLASLEIVSFKNATPIKTKIIAPIALNISSSLAFHQELKIKPNKQHPNKASARRFLEIIHNLSHQFVKFIS